MFIHKLMKDREEVIRESLEQGYEVKEISETFVTVKGPFLWEYIFDKKFDINNASTY